MSSRKEARFEIRTHPERCAGCLDCELRCAQRFHRIASPLLAAIRVETSLSGRVGATVTFTEQCDSCGICARHCAYGALELRTREDSN